MSTVDSVISFYKNTDEKVLVADERLAVLWKNDDSLPDFVSVETFGNAFSLPLRESKILQYISDVFPCDRKTIGRNIKALQSVGYPIVKTSKGFYMNNKVFSIQEEDFVLQAIEQAQDVEQVNKTELCAKLQSCLGGFLKR